MPAKISQSMKKLKQAYSINFVSLLTLFFIGLLCLGSPLSAETTQLGNKKWERQNLGNDKSLTGINKIDDHFVGVGDNDSLITLGTESPREYVIEVFAEPEEGGIVTGEGIYAENEEFTVTAIPNEGYYFKKWLSCPQDPLGMPMVCYGVSRDAEFIFIASFFGQTDFKANFKLYGDVNFDDVIDVQDASLAMRHVLGIKMFDEDQKIAADVNSDDQINVQDVTLIMQKALGKIDKFPVKTGLDFERPALDDLPYEVKAWVEGSREKFTAQTYEYNDMLYILISYGWCPTTGYAVQVRDIIQFDSKVVVIALFTIESPAGQAFTNPYDLVVLEDPSLPVEFIATGAETEIPNEE